MLDAGTREKEKRVVHVNVKSCLLIAACLVAGTGQAGLQIAWPNEIIVTENTGGSAQVGAILRGALPFGW